MSDEKQDEDGVDLSGDDPREFFFGLAVTVAALIAVALWIDVGAAVVLAAVIAFTYLLLVLIVALCIRSFGRATAAVNRWTFGFLGRWLPL